MERRILMLQPMHQLLLREGQEIVLGGECNARMFRCVRLDHHAAALAAATRAAGHLGEQLKRPLGCPEVPDFMGEEGLFTNTGYSERRVSPFSNRLQCLQRRPNPPLMLP